LRAWYPATRAGPLRGAVLTPPVEQAGYQSEFGMGNTVSGRRALLDDFLDRHVAGREGRR
jgi:hypothetical protein